MGLAVERKWLKFQWRITEKIYSTKSGQLETKFVVERCTILFGIPFWWTEHWGRNSCDGVNLNQEEWGDYKQAREQLLKEKAARAYENQISISKTRHTTAE